MQKFTILQKKINQALNWAEKKTKTDMRYLIRGGFWITLSDLIPLPLSFLLAYVYARLPKEAYGAYTYALSLAATLSFFTLSGIDTGVIGAVARGHDRTVFLALRKKILGGILGSGIGLLIAGYLLFFNKDSGSALLLLITLAFLPFINSFPLYQSFLSGKKQFAALAKFQTISKLITTIVIIIAIVGSHQVIIILFANQAIYTLVNTLFYYISLRKYYNAQTTIDESSITYGKHLSFSTFLNTIIGQFDNIILFNLLGPGALAIYTYAVLPPKQLSGFLGNISKLALPKFAVQDPIELKKNIFNKTIKFTLFVIPIFLAYFFLSPYMYHWFFARYDSSIPYSQIFSLSLLTVGSELPYAMLNSLQAKRAMYQINTIAPVLKLVCTVVGIYGFGLTGAMVGRVIYNFGYFALTLLLAQRSTLNKNVSSVSSLTS
jgi:O-antigen/teichoic acid export membrane protein